MCRFAWTSLFVATCRILFSIQLKFSHPHNIAKCVQMAPVFRKVFFFAQLSTSERICMNTAHVCSFFMRRGFGKVVNKSRQPLLSGARAVVPMFQNGKHFLIPIYRDCCRRKTMMQIVLSTTASCHLKVFPDSNKKKKKDISKCICFLCDKKWAKCWSWGNNAFC